MKNSLQAKKILAIVAAVAVLIVFIRNGSYGLISKWSEYISQNSDAEGAISLTDIDSEFSDNLWNQRDFIDINGFMAKILGIRGLYGDEGMYVTKSGYIESAYDPTSTDFEVEQLTGFRDFLSENGINLLYVNEPTKYVDDEKFTEEFGLPTYSNANADKFMERIREAGINCVDLRDNIAEEGLNVEDLFYRTDHHWKVPAGLWAAGIMAKALNEDCGYNIDLSTYDIDRYERRDFTNCWLGEQGRKVGKSYVGLDDYTELKPAFETSFTFKDDDGPDTEGDFSNFVSESFYDTDKDVYDAISWHYSYDIEDCINHKVDEGKVLLIADSYAMVTEPFLALGVHELDCIFLRQESEDFSIRNFVMENGYDTVIVAYAQMGIGAHDDGANVNYNMFNMDK